MLLYNSDKGTVKSTELHSISPTFNQTTLQSSIKKHRVSLTEFNEKYLQSLGFTVKKQ